MDNQERYEYFKLLTTFDSFVYAYGGYNEVCRLLSVGRLSGTEDPYCICLNHFGQRYSLSLYSVLPLLTRKVGTLSSEISEIVNDYSGIRHVILNHNLSIEPEELEGEIDVITVLKISILLLKKGYDIYGLIEKNQALPIDQFSEELSLFGS